MTAVMAMVPLAGQAARLQGRKGACNADRIPRNPDGRPPPPVEACPARGKGHDGAEHNGACLPAGHPIRTSPISYATAAAAAFFRSFVTTKTSKDIEATHAHFHPGKMAYFDATVGFGWPTNADLRKL